jgi:LCP family protein required for cell wall assembly
VNISGGQDNVVLAAQADTPTPLPSQQPIPATEQLEQSIPDEKSQPANVPALPTTSEPSKRNSLEETVRETFTQAIRTIDQAAQAVSDQATRINSSQLFQKKSGFYSVYAPGVSRAIPPTPAPPTPEPPPPEVHFTSDEGRAWSDYPGPSLWPDMQAPPPVGILSHPEDQINILLLGSDQRPNDSGFRTDTIQLMTINPSVGSVKLTSFPRDLYVNIPGYTVQRINTAFGWGGFEALADTMEYNFGVRPEYYVLLNFDSFIDVIDSLGGVVVSVGRDFCDHRDAFGEFCISQSDYWMNGKTALWYVRSRHTTSDLDRGRRQQEVLQAVFERLISINGLTRIPELYDIYKKNVETNIDLNLITSLLPVALHQAEARDVSNYSIGRGQVYDWINYSGAMVLVPMRDSVLEIMREVISEP